MKASVRENILYIESASLPIYKKSGSVVRNSFFWSLKSIACRARKGEDWEFDSEVWVALARMLLCFTASGYLGHSETILEFSPDCPIPDSLRSTSTYL